MLDTLRDFLKLASAAGTLLVGAVVLAMICASSPLAGHLAALPAAASARG
jgi:Na+/H+ antiporter NhaA